MAQLVAPLQAATAGLTILNQVQTGKFENQLAKAKADARDREAGQARAAGQRKAAAARREAGILRSNAVAFGAARAASADGDTENVLARIEREGAFKSRTALSGDAAEGQRREFQGRVLRVEGKERQRRHNVRALDEGLSFFEKFAGGGYR